MAIGRPEISGRVDRVGPYGIKATALEGELQVIRGPNGCINVDGSIKLSADSRLHLRAEDNPPFLVRTSRRSDGASCPNSTMSNILMTGHSRLAHFIDDGSEVSDYGLFEINQDNPEASCMLLANKERPEYDTLPTNRKAATNSQKWIHDGIFNKRFKPIKNDNSIGACLRIVGEVTQLTVERIYFTSEQKGTPAIVIVNAPDEQGADWGRDNCPKYIEIKDCTWEGPGKGRIVLFGIPATVPIKITGQFADSFEIISLPFDGKLDNPIDNPLEEPEYIPNTDPVIDLLNIVQVVNVSPTKPATLTRIQEQVPAGAVLELNGGNYSQTVGNYRPIYLNGTADNPVVLRGINWPRFNSTLHITGQYAVIEGIDVKKLSFAPGCNNIRVKKCKVHGDTTGEGSVQGGGIAIAGSTALPVSKIIIEQCEIFDNGSGLLANYDQDVHGITINGVTNNILIRNNLITGNSGDGVQINAGSMANEDNLNRIFVLNNLIFANKQVGVALKQCKHVVVGFNEIHSHTPIGTNPSAWGAAIGLQYNPKDAFIISNYCHHNADGITTSSGSGLGSGENCYIIDNVIMNNIHNPNYPYNPNTAWSNAGIRKAGIRNMVILNNYIQGCDAGINIVDVGGTVDIQGNLIMDVLQNHLFAETNSGTLVFSNNNLEQSNNDDIRFRLGNQVTRNQFINGNKKSGVHDNKLINHPAFTLFNDLFGVNIA